LASNHFTVPLVSNQCFPFLFSELSRLVIMFRAIASSSIRRSAAYLTAANGRSKLPTSSFVVRAALFSTTEGAAEKLKGTVKWFDAKKGFGFLMPEDGGSDVFVHHSAIYSHGFRTLGDGEEVEFEVFQEDNGRLKAFNVTGPAGAYVQGAERPSYEGGNNSQGGNDSYDRF